MYIKFSFITKKREGQVASLSSVPDSALGLAWPALLGCSGLIPGLWQTSFEGFSFPLGALVKVFYI